MRIAIIGAGNMGGATALGLARYCQGAEITATAKHQATLEKYSNSGIRTTLDNTAAVSWADLVVMGVKPWLLKEVLTPLLPLMKGKILVSLAAGIPAATLKEWTEGFNIQGVYTVIPNLAIEIGESMTFINEVFGTQETLSSVSGLFQAVGKALVVDEKRLGAGMMVASCGTAFALRYVRAATEGGVELGLYPKEALEAALQTVKGAAMLADAHGTHPEQEIDKVTTPGGITIRGLNAMEEAGFSNAVIQGLKIWK
ncbi:MAG: pyrroline-5-carboxylate reductase [Bacteroidales bacterium]|nr:pyrroline-5-carboxylate reductase [Bacteroidales bacterium]